MRARLARHGVAQPAFEVIDTRPVEPRATRVVNAANRLGYPVVVKPVSLSGSRGVIRADDDDAAIEATRRIEALLDRIGEPDDLAVVVESFAIGDEFALEGLLSAGTLEVLTIFDKPDPLDGPYFEETIYLTPSELEPADQQAIAVLVGDAARAIGLLEGPVHAEVRLDRRSRYRLLGRPVLIEVVTARTIGGRCATALRFSTGTTLEEIVLAHALGRLSELDTSRPPGALGGAPRCSRSPAPGCSLASADALVRSKSRSSAGSTSPSLRVISSKRSPRATATWASSSRRHPAEQRSRRPFARRIGGSTSILTHVSPRPRSPLRLRDDASAACVEL